MMRVSTNNLVIFPEIEVHVSEVFVSLAGMYNENTMKESGLSRV
jgi:hypothetical protein